MYNGLLHAHSGLRWIALFLLLFAIIQAFSSQSSGRYEKKHKMVNLFAMIVLHTQLLIGLGLYFMNSRGLVNYAEGWMGNTAQRFYGMEHLVGMIVAIALVTIGRKKAEKLENTRDKHRKIGKSYLFALIIILASIPWPFRSELVGAWF